MDVPRNAQNLILTAQVLDDAEQPVTGITFNGGSLEITKRGPSDIAWLPLTLVAGSVGSYVSNSWIEVGAGLYQFCPANDIIEPGQAVKIRATVTGVTQPIYGIINAIGESAKNPGERSVFVTVRDEDGSVVPGAKVKIFDDESSFIAGQIERTDTVGRVEFWLNDGSYRARAGGLAGYDDAGLVDFTVDEENEEVGLTINSSPITQPKSPGLCAVVFYVRHNGKLVRGASVTATLTETGSYLDETAISTVNDTDTTDASGRAVLQLIREDQFLTGSGQYKIDIVHRGQVIASHTTAIPSTSAASFEDILRKFFPTTGNGEGIGYAPTVTAS